MQKIIQHIFAHVAALSRRQFALPTALLLLLSFCTPLASFAQVDTSKMSITIAPPLYQLTIAPGTLWKSTLRVVNTNPYPLVVHTTVADFHPNGETGNAVFDDLSHGSAVDTRLMSGWITLPSGDITVLPDRSYEIPFSIMVPVNADPGGHYGAIMVGTLPPDIAQGSGASVGSMLTSLIFLRVPGEVVEEGLIRDFYTAKDVVPTPEQSFALRFENKGNVHLVPQGEIVITNMWGKTRGTIKVNEASSFGNVLPGSTRKFAFEWKGEESLFDIGRYKAEAVLSYGEQNKQSAVRTTYFWIIPWGKVGATLFTIVFLIWFFTWSIRRYIRRALQLEREHLFGAAAGESKAAHREAAPAPHAKPHHHEAASQRLTLELLKRPLVLGAAELSKGGVRAAHVSHAKAVHGKHRQHTSYIEWAKRYRMFILFVCVFILGCALIGWYFVEVFQEERAYQVTEIRPKG